MKFLPLLLLTLPLLTHTYPAEEEKTLTLDEDVASVAVEDHDTAASAKESQLQKRSGSTDYVVHLKSGILSSLGHASASIASGSSGSSSGGGYGGGGHGGGHGDGHHGNSVDFDPWSLKKTVLTTIFQAVKAITGGVTALKGQLIKGSGYALSASGHLVATTGDKVTDVGKHIINSATSKLHGIPSGGGHGGGHGGSGGSFGKFASLSGASSGGSSGSGGKPSSSGHVVHQETITSYEIPSGHTSYGPPSKAPTFSSATHQYLPPSGSGGYTGGSSGYGGGGHVAFEAPSSNYLPSSYGHDVTGQEFNIYPRHKKLNDDEARKAAVQLQEILNMLPNGKTEYTASKTVQLDTSNLNSGSGGNYGPSGSGDHAELSSYGLPNNLGQLESLSHTESITAAYAADIYHQMQRQKKKQNQNQQLTVEELYIRNHPNEGYNFVPDNHAPHSSSSGYGTSNDNSIYSPPTKEQTSTGYAQYNSYQPPPSGHNAKDAFKDLTPIIAALEVVQQQKPAKATLSFAVEKNVHKLQPPSGPGSPSQAYLPAATVQKSKYIYYPPEYHTQYKPVYNGGAYKVRRHVPESATTRTKRKVSLFGNHDFGNQDHIMYSPLVGNF